MKVRNFNSLYQGEVSKSWSSMDALAGVFANVHSLQENVYALYKILRVIHKQNSHEPQT